MKNARMIMLCCTAFLFLPCTHVHAYLRITAAADKPVYQLNEFVIISITVSNVGQTVQALQGGGLYYKEEGSYAIRFTDYILDDSYVWSEHLPHGGAGLMWSMNFYPGESRTWLMSHDAPHMQNYPLTFGTHSIVGKAGFTLYSTPVTFQVIPEPCTLFLLTLGGLALRQRNVDRRFYVERNQFC